MKIIKLYQRQVVKRTPVRGVNRGERFVLELSCGHKKEMSKNGNGHVAKATNCPKCELGLVKA